MSFYNPNTTDEEWLLSLPPYKRRRRRLYAARDLGTHTNEQWVAKRDAVGRCAICGASDRALQKDHIVPISRGGSEAIDNIQPLCGPCNASKGAR
jgi:5-methylcytosine-specific restriction endonuclease McrA